MSDSLYSMLRFTLCNFYNINYSRFKALLAFILNEKHGTMVEISRQYPFGTDKAAQVSQTACCDKGTQLRYFKQKNINHLINPDIGS